MLYSNMSIFGQEFGKYRGDKFARNGNTHICNSSVQSLINATKQSVIN